MKEIVVDHAARISVIVRKTFSLFIKLCYLSARDHPLLLAFLLFLLLLYISFPSLFAFLVSTSPVLICTALLLGTLLSFGQPNLHEIDGESNKDHDIASLRATLSEGETIVERCRNGSFTAERLVLKDPDSLEGLKEDGSIDSKGTAKLLMSDASSMDQIELHIEFKKQLTNEDEGEYVNSETEHDVRWGIADASMDEGDAVRLYTQVREEGEIVERNSITRDENHVDLDKSELSVASQKHVEERNTISDSGSSDAVSDEVESSSDASIPDITPMLDELHPLLNSEDPQPSIGIHDAASDLSHKCNDGSNDSTEDSEEEDREVDDDDEREQEKTHGNFEDEMKSAIIWTEDDQKNLMDLGTLELERNRRLENLIARRRVRKNARIMAENNLIDLDTGDLPFPVAPISTTKHNPFDLPYNSDDIGILPIPGSAPSVLLPGQNPFDLPCDSSEEKADVDIHFHKEFTPLHGNDVLYRRHESFSSGSSFLGFPREAKQRTKFRPIFIPEKCSSLEAGDPSIHSQSSESSDSKESSILEIDTAASFDHKYENSFNENIGPQFLGNVSQSCEDVISDNRIQIDLTMQENEIGSGLSTQMETPIAESNMFGIEKNSSNLKIIAGESNSATSDIDGETSSESNSSSSSESDQSFDAVENTGLDSSIKINISVNAIDIREPVYDSSPVLVDLSSSMPSDIQVSEIGSPLKTTTSNCNMESLSIDTTTSASEVIFPNQLTGSSEGSDLSILDKQHQLPVVEIYSPVESKARVVDNSPDDLEAIVDTGAIKTEIEEPSMGLKEPTEYMGELITKAALAEDNMHSTNGAIDSFEATKVSHDGKLAQINSGSTHRST